MLFFDQSKDEAVHRQDMALPLIVREVTFFAFLVREIALRDLTVTVRLCRIVSIPGEVRGESLHPIQ